MSEPRSRGRRAPAGFGLREHRMPYRPDPIFNDSLEPTVFMSARAVVGLTVAAVLSLCFALIVSLCILARAVFEAPGKLLRKTSH